MPIGTDTDSWTNGARIEPLQDEVLEYLQSNPNQAFHEREIADEVTNSNWQAAHESERLCQQLDEEEFDRRLHNDELPDSDIPRYYNFHELLRLIPALLILLDENKIEQREVDADGFGFPYDWDTVGAYSYLQD